MGNKGLDESDGRSFMVMLYVPSKAIRERVGYVEEKVGMY